LTAASVCFFFLEKPDSSYDLELNGDGVSASGTSVYSGQDTDVDALISKFTPNITTFRFFLEDWNCFLYVGARTVEFDWEEAG
jgi:hypothetical protein